MLGDMADINLFASLAAFIATFFSGFLWFNAKTFFPVWWKLMGRENSAPGSTGHEMGVVFASQSIAIVIQVVILELVLDQLGGADGLGAIAGAGWGFALGTCAAFAMLGHRLFGGYGYKLWIVEVGNDVVNWTIIGFVLSALG